jgi:DNA-binding NarL/FixJ family response regulator
MSIRVVVADDHAIVREGIKMVLQNSGKDIKVVGEAENGRDVLDLAVGCLVDVFIMDIAMPKLNGLETTSRLLKKDPQCKVIILSMYDDAGTVEKAMGSGARGYLIKETAIEDVVHAIGEVHKGRKFLSPKIAHYLTKKFRGQQHDYDHVTSVVHLTDKEKEVLQMLAEGSSSKEIAQRLELSFHTVNVHRNNIMRKLNLHKSADLVRYAIKEGLVHL